MIGDGATLFSRFAFPPNHLGYCGPSDTGLLGELMAAGEDGLDEMRQVIPDFDGAWPYLELIAACTGLDPLDPEVIEAYWLGSPLLERIDLLLMGNSIEQRFRRRAGHKWDAVTGGLNSGTAPTTPSTSFASIPGSGCSGREWSIQLCKFLIDVGSVGVWWKDQWTPKSWCDHVYCIGTACRLVSDPKWWSRSRRRWTRFLSNLGIWSRCIGTTCVRESRVDSSGNSSTITTCISESSTEVHRSWHRSSEVMATILGCLPNLLFLGWLLSVADVLPSH